MKLVVLISGRGSDLQSIIDAIDLGLLDASIEMVISNNPDAYGLERARKHNIPSMAVLHRGKKREEFERELIDIIDPIDPDLIVLAGFMRRLTSLFVNHYRGRIINIHPALLPSFPGAHAHRDALAYGVKVTGCTVHFVTEDVDGGPIILQYPVFVHEDDDEETLSQRVLRVEHRILPLAVKLFCDGRLSVEGRRVRISGFTEEELMNWMHLCEEKGLE